MNYTKLNNYTGWAVFAIAFLTYFLTTAPTASFWDCGEFIACAHELEVTHPPGAPLFLLIGRIFSMFALDKQHVAVMINMISVLSSAFTALFTCWVTTYFSTKILKNLDWDEDLKLYGTMFAGAVAGLACTFADSIWFNAVEAEVYAMSGFFTAIVGWLMTKWEVRADEPDHYKWIILIAYVMGLSIGVHLLNLLTIPALALMFYFRKFPAATATGIIATLGISILILAFVQYGIIQYTFSIAQQFEIFFTGSMTRTGEDRGGMNMGMGTGTFAFTLLIISIVVGILVYSVKKNNIVLNVAVLSYIVIMMGFSSYAVIFVRSGANPPIDMNNPENIMTFLSYMRREQYGERPLVKGPMYNAVPKNDGKRYLFEDKYMRYTLFEGKNKYVEDEMKQDYRYENEDIKWFPRMYSESHYAARPFGYQEFVKNKGENPQDPNDDLPTAGEDIAFAFRYQLVHMYLRYFMWNFVGKESDIQDDDWESGFNLRAESSHNKANNHYFFLPLMLGMLGLVWQFSHKNKDASIVGLLFFFTGIAIIIYLNQTPAQPRERDYAYASSFQTFCIWIGMGVLFLIETVRGIFKKRTAFIVGGVSLLVPALMCAQNWDDHTRKNRWIDVEFAYNLLNSCAKNAILFTAGDNDTFPLWYAQEVENVRPDVRVVNLELLISDWYIRQMQMQKNESAPLPILMKYNDYAGEKYNYYMGAKAKPFRILTNKEAMVKAGAITEAEKIGIADTFVWNFPSKGAILRKDSAMINVIRNIANSNWDRPIYFANTIPPENYHGLTYQLQMEGMAHRLLPIKLQPETPRDIMTEGIVNQAKMYENVVKNFKYTGLNDPKLNADEHIRMVIISNYRNTMHRLMASYGQQIENWEAQMEIVKTPDIDSLAKIGLDVANIPTANPPKIAAAKVKLKEIYDFSLTTIPYNVIEPSLTYLTWCAEMLGRAGLNKEAETEFSLLKDRSMKDLHYFDKNKIKVDKRHPAVTGAVMTIQHLAQSGHEQEAMTLAEELYILTGHDLRGVLQGQ